MGNAGAARSLDEPEQEAPTEYGRELIEYIASVDEAEIEHFRLLNEKYGDAAVAQPEGLVEYLETMGPDELAKLDDELELDREYGDDIARERADLDAGRHPLQNKG